MAADDDQTPEPDPWADLQADDLEAEGGEISFQFGGDAEPPAADDAPVVKAEDDVSTPPAESADDAAAQAWLAEADVAADAVAAAGDAIEIGTGLSGIEDLAGDDEAADDEAADDILAAVEQESVQVEAWGDFGTPVGGEAGEVAEDTTAGAEADAGGFDFAEPDAGVAAVVPVAAAATATAAAPRRGKPAPRKQAGGIGQMIGVVAGGVMAIPITLAILIWGLQKDPFGVTKMVPEQAAFLLPQKFRPGFKKARAAAGIPTATGGSPLDAVASTGDVPAAEPAADEAAAPTEDLSAGDLPVPDLSDLATAEQAVPAPVDEPVDVGSSESVEPFPAATGDEVSTTADATVPAATDASEPPPAPDLGDVAAVTAPGLDSLPAVPPAPPEPEPLDTAALDAALAEAGALGEALAAVEDRSARSSRLLIVQWYQSLASVAEQLASLERAAADAGQPLSETPEQVAAFHAALIAGDPQLSDLGRVAWDWLAFRKRQGAGVVLPVTFASARRVGPYWSATATLDKGDGTRRVLSIVSRSEPAAVAGDRLLVTGLVLDENVIWAADWRPADGGGEGQGGEPASEPGFEPPAEPAAEPAADPVIEPVSEPPAEPAIEPAAETTVTPGDEPAIEPGGDPAADQPAASDPAPAEGAADAAEPATEPAAPF